MTNVPPDRLLHAGQPAREVYAHQLARVDKLGPNRRLVFTVPSPDGLDYHSVVVKLIMPAEAVAALADMVVEVTP
jgi:hypothetical protein